VKKLIAIGAAAAVIGAVVSQILPDVKRYLRMRCM
jgi:hypothetical protein